MDSYKMVSLFLGSTTLQPIAIDCPQRYAMINPKYHGGFSNSEVFALVPTSEGEIQTSVRDGVMIDGDFHFAKFQEKNKTLFLNISSSSIDYLEEKLVHSPSEYEVLSDNRIKEIEENDSRFHGDLDNHVTSQKMEGFVSGTPNLVNIESTLQSILLSKHKYHRLSKNISSCEMFFSCEIIEQVEEIPQHYNGNCTYELAPICGAGSTMEGMEQKYNGHCCVKPVQTKMKFLAMEQRSKCGGYFMCNNPMCSIRAHSGAPNTTTWIGKHLHAIPSIDTIALRCINLSCFYHACVHGQWRRCANKSQVEAWQYLKIIPIEVDIDEDVSSDEEIDAPMYLGHHNDLSDALRVGDNLAINTKEEDSNYYILRCCMEKRLSITT
ncbi:hypothetical protein L7F22_059989 [Adiantum nelumboides]|nr:hypothetical protein [Adiantum nelumboides]